MAIDFSLCATISAVVQHVDSLPDSVFPYIESENDLNNQPEAISAIARAAMNRIVDLCVQEKSMFSFVEKGIEQLPPNAKFPVIMQMSLRTIEQMIHTQRILSPFVYEVKKDGKVKGYLVGDKERDNSLATRQTPIFREVLSQSRILAFNKSLDPFPPFFKELFEKQLPSKLSDQGTDKALSEGLGVTFYYNAEKLGIPTCELPQMSREERALLDEREKPLPRQLECPDPDPSVIARFRQCKIEPRLTCVASDFAYWTGNAKDALAYGLARSSRLRMQKVYEFNKQVAASLIDLMSEVTEDERPVCAVISPLQLFGSEGINKTLRTHGFEVTRLQKLSLAD